MLINWLSRVGLLLARSRHSSEHLLLLLFVELLIVSLGEIFELLHLCDFLFSLLTDFDLSNRLSLTGCNTQTESTLVKEVSHTVTFGLLTLSLLVGATNLIGSHVLLSGKEIAVLLLECSEMVPHLVEELISLAD